MSQANNPHITNPSRRRVLAGLSLAAAVPAVASVDNAFAGAYAAAADPIFVAIEAHRAAFESFQASSKIYGQLRPGAHGYWAVSAAHSRADKRETEALLALLTTPPATLAGAVALLDHVGLPEFDDPECGQTILSGALETNNDELRQASFNFPALLATTLRMIAAAAT